ncbi:Mammalian cell entry related domain protein [Candidatus Sulfopaludibacter sp. SbA4]|nr:Mammalian cell entry related domain protein [Candidatus Sulfopaludibacter sp. SbA4]
MPSVSRVNWAKFRVAAVCVVATIILATLVYLLTGGTLLQQKATVYLYIPDASGLTSGSPVRVDGIDVGKVDSVNLSGSKQPNRVIRVAMTVERGRLASVPADSFAQLSSEDLAGDKFVDITSGRSTDRMAPNGELSYKEQTDFMKSLDLSQVAKQLRDVDAVITDIEQGKSRLGQFIQGDEFYRDLRRRTTELQNGMRTIASTTNEVGQSLYTDKLYRQVSEPLATLDQDLAKLQSGQGTGGQLLRDSAQYDQLQASARDLQKTIGDLRSGDFLKSDQMYNEWCRGLAALIQNVEQMNADPMLERSETYDNINGYAKEMRDLVRDFRKDPRKFLRLKF